MRESLQNNKQKIIASKIQINSVKKVYYIFLIENEDQRSNNINILVSMIIEYESLLTLLSENKEHLDKSEIIKLFEKSLNDFFNDKDIINFEKLTDSLSSLTEQKKTFLNQYITRYLNV